MVKYRLVFSAQFIKQDGFCSRMRLNRRRTPCRTEPPATADGTNPFRLTAIHEADRYPSLDTHSVCTQSLFSLPLSDTSRSFGILTGGR